METEREYTTPRIIPFSFNEKIIHRFLFKVFSLKDMSFFNGKIGIAISLFHYGKHTQNDIYIDFANDLIDGYLANVDKRIGFSFASGLSGIGWAIEYLIQHKLVEGISHEACKDIDDFIMSVNIRRMTNLSLEEGLEGILHYILARIKGNKNQNSPFPFDELFMQDVQNKLLAIEASQIPSMLNSLINDFQNDCSLYKLDIIPFINKEIIIEESDIAQANLGLNKGLAGRLLYSTIEDRK